MKVGDLCRVISTSAHTTSQFHHLVLVIKDMHDHVEGLNTRTGKFHHYRKEELEVVSEGR
jgi:hypothetical protein